MQEKFVFQVDAFFHALIANGAVVIAALSCAAVVRFGMLYALETYMRQGARVLPQGLSLRRHFFPSLLLLVAGIALLFTMPLMGLPETLHDPMLKGVRLFTIFGAAWSAHRAIVLGRIVLFANLDISGADNLKERSRQTQILFVEKFLLLMSWVIGVGAGLFLFEGARRFGTSLLASAGLAGVAIGFAAQRSLANLLAGFQIAFTQPIRIDDVVVVEKEWGRIEEITLTYVVVRLWDLRRMVLPITYFTEKPFENWTRTSAQTIGTAYIHADYSVDIEDLRRKFMEILRGTPLWDGDTAALQVTNATEHSLEIRMIMSALDSSRAFDLRCVVRESLVRYIQNKHPQHLPKSRYVLEH